jgi:hypothetical protein
MSVGTACAARWLFWRTLVRSLHCPSAATSASASGSVSRKAVANHWWGDVGSSPIATSALAASWYTTNENTYINTVMLYTTGPPKSNPHKQPLLNKQHKKKLICSIFNDGLYIYSGVTWVFNWSHHSSPTVGFRSLEPQTDMNARKLLGAQCHQPVQKFHNSATTTTTYELTVWTMSQAASTSHDHMGLHGLLQGQAHLRFLTTCSILWNLRLGEYLSPFQMRPNISNVLFFLLLKYSDFVNNLYLAQETADLPESIPHFSVTVANIILMFMYSLLETVATQQ